MEKIDINKFFIKLSSKVIAGENMLLSKNKNLFSPDNWPTYYKKAKGCYIWDLNGKKYIDMCLMGVGTNILGYAVNSIDKKVIASIKNSNMSTLNCSEEVMLAKELLKINSWADQVRFARTGADASSIAIRLSRAFTKKDKIILCGYHGWHDWYIASNLKKKNLNQHLFPNLNTKGVPKIFSNLIYSIEYGDIKSFLQIIKNDIQIGTVIMEISRNKKIDLNFLKIIRRETVKKGITLIFDECTSGFRENFGGLHKKINIFPDLVTFGKALGNGYAITAVLGKKKIMNTFSDTFISSTFWTERSGYVAALETLRIMKKTKPWLGIIKKGIKIKENWKKLSEKYSVPIKIFGLDAIPSFSFENKENNLIYKTFLTQEFLKKNILASNMIYISTAHKKKHIDKYFYNLEKIFKTISSSPLTVIKKKIFGRICFNSMARMN